MAFVQCTLVAFLILVSSFGRPTVAQRACHCLTDSDTSNLVAGFTTIAAEHAGYEEVAAQILVDNFTSISDSVNFVDGIPVNCISCQTLLARIDVVYSSTRP